MATKGTLSSELFAKTSNLFSSGINVIEQNGEGIVELIENGKLDTDEMKSLLKLYLQPMIDANIDHLVLGCTHYPYLIPQLLQLVPNHVKIIDSGEAVARQTKSVLSQNNMLNKQPTKPNLKFYTNGNPAVMQSLLEDKFEVECLDF